MLILWFFLLEPTQCSVLCRGNYVIKTVDPTRQCVGYAISFKLNKSLTAKFRDFHCKIPGCLLEVVDFVCPIYDQYAGIPLNKTSSNENGGNVSCLGNLLSWIVLSAYLSQRLFISICILFPEPLGQLQPNLIQSNIR